MSEKLATVTGTIRPSITVNADTEFWVGGNKFEAGVYAIARLDDPPRDGRRRDPETVANWRSPDFGKKRGSAAIVIHEPAGGYTLYLWPPNTTNAEMETHQFTDRDDAIRAHREAVAGYSQ